MDKNKKDSSIPKILIISLAIIIFLLLLFSVIFSLISINQNTILNGISINGLNVSNMSKEEAISTLTEIISKKQETNIVISTSENNSVTTTFDYLEIKYDINSAVNNAYLIGRSGNIFENNFAILNLIFHPKNIELNVTFNEDNLGTLMDEISANLPHKLVQSSYYVEDGNLIVTKGSIGDIISEENFIKQLDQFLNCLNLEDLSLSIPTQTINPNEIDIDKIYDEIHKNAQDAYYEKNPFQVHSEVIGVSFDKDFAKNLLKEEQEEYIIPLEYTYPKITVTDLDIDIFKDTLSSFTTKYDLSNKDRITNLELAASKINGTILAPGEEFSYNMIVGARTIAAGYKEAKIYSNGKVVDGIGGGICQISSTLYNSAVLANLDITERYNHQFLTSYVDPGRDATVVYGVKDLKFKNNRSFPIKIEMKVSNSIVSCNIYGLMEKQEYDIDFVVETLSIQEPIIQYEYDSNIKPGNQEIRQSGSNGTTVNVYKIVKLNGSILTKTLLSQDTYNALEKIVVKNPIEQ